MLSDLGMHCLPMCHKKDAKLIRVKSKMSIYRRKRIHCLHKSLNEHNVKIELMRANIMLIYSQT